MRRIFGVLEDRRIDESTRAHYPGARRDLDAVLAAARSAASDEAPVEWRAALLESLQLHSLGATRDELAARVLPGLRPVLASVLDLVGSLDSADESARAAIAIGELLDEDLDLAGDPTYAITQDVDVDEAGAIDPPDDRPSADADVPRPPSDDMRQEQTDREQLGRLADIDAIDPELPVEEDPGSGAGTPSDPVPAPTRRGPRRPDLLLRRVGPRRRAQAAGLVPRRGAPAGGRRSIVHRRRAATSRAC